MRGISFKCGRKIVAAVAVLCAALLVSSPLMADTSYDFSSPAGILGTSQVYNGTNGGSITAYGWGCFTSLSGVDASSTPNASCFSESYVAPIDLYGKTDGVGETGLGFANDPLGDNEVSQSDYIQFDLTNAGGTSGNWTFGSVQSGEEVYYCFGTSDSISGDCGSYTGTGSSALVTIPLDWSGYNNLYVIGAQNDILVSSATAVPEPGSLALFGTGLLGLVGVIRRKINL